MKRYARVCFGWLLFVVLVSTGGAVHADDDLTCYCDVNEMDAAASPPAPLHPTNVFNRLKPDMEAGAWKQVGTELLGVFTTLRGELTDGERTQYAAQLTLMESQLRAFADELAATSDNPKWAADFARREIAVWNLRFKSSREDDDSFKLLILLDPNGAMRPNPIHVTADMSDAVARALCWPNVAAQRVVSFFHQGSRDFAVKAMDGYVQLWDNYNTKGYRQLPWELVVNGHLFMKTNNMQGVSLVPPRWQFIVLHPSVGVELIGTEPKDLIRSNSVFAELGGVIWYVKSRKSYFGVSAILSFPSDEVVGYGALAHMGRVAKVGYVFRSDAPGGESRNGFVVSIDLYSWLAGVPDQLTEERNGVAGVVDNLKAMLGGD